MIENEENKNKKLTLGGTKLTLNRSHLNKVTKTLSSSGSTVVVEVKRGKAVSSPVSLNKESASNFNIDDSQVNRRLSALQRAKEEVDDEEHKISSLSKLAEMNQVIESENIEVEKEEVKPLITEIAIENKKELSHKAKQKNIDLDEDSKDSKAEEGKLIPTKPKLGEPRKLKKSDIFHMLSEDSDEIPLKTRSLASIKRAKAKEKRKSEGEFRKQEKIYREVIIPEVITVGELSNRMTERVADVTRELIKMGVIASSNQSIDADTAELVVSAFGHSVKRVQESDVENILITKEDKPEDLKPRAPIVTVMGHVDHGKTSLLDALKSTDVVAGEAGGITQHIGAYSVRISDNRMITFIDTPGHEAFTEMRTRGAKVNDIVVLVVAADDGIKTQTVEAINHAKAAKVPIIVAINKIDKPEADIERVKNELLLYDLVPEDFGGDVMTVPVSAKTKINLDKLEETILLVAEMQELKANPDTDASGVVIESRVDKGIGVIATVIIQRGTLKQGDLIIAGTSYGKVKRMNNDKGRSIVTAGPSLAVEIHGLNETPSAGDFFNGVATDKQARDITEYRLRLEKEKKVTSSKSSLEDLFQKASGDSKIKELPIIIKGDVHGSIEAIVGSLNKIESDEVKLKILHSAVGAITESDVTLARASGSLIIGFNVRSNSAADEQAEKNKIDVRYYSIIYNLIDDVKGIVSGMLSPIIREQYIGSVDIREVFNVSKVGKVAGSYVTKGIIKRGAGVRLIRDNIVIYEGKLKTLKRFKDEVKEVREGFECGIAFENYDDIKVSDIVEVFEIVKEKKQL